MQVSVRGKNDVLSKREVKFLVKQFGEVLLGPRLTENIYILTQYIKNLDAYGYCSPTDQERHHREFEILLNPNISRNNQIRTIAHEMVHVYQFSRGLLRQTNGENYKWMGRKIYIGDIEYSKIPWEIQAFVMEDELYKWYQKTLKEQVKNSQRTS